MTFDPRCRACSAVSCGCSAVQLLLTVLFSFITLGLVSRVFGPRQQVIIAMVAVMLMLVQFTFSRFL